MHTYFLNKYFSLEIPCYDNEDEPVEGPTGGQETNQPGDQVNDDGKVFYTADVNRIVEERLARDRKTREESNKVVEKQLQEALKSKELSEQQRGELQNALEDVQKQLRTKESQLAKEKQEMQAEYEEKIKESQQLAVQWEERFRQSSISRSLQDAAVNNDAYNASQVVNLLTPMTRLVESKDEEGKTTGDFEVVIDFPDVNPETGESFTAKYTPVESVKRMKELQDYANLFKANIVSGVGTNNATGGVTSGSNGPIDVSKLTIEQYAKLRKEQPELLGMKR